MHGMSDNAAAVTSYCELQTSPSGKANPRGILILLQCHINAFQAKLSPELKANPRGSTEKENVAPHKSNICFLAVTGNP